MVKPFIVAYSNARDALGDYFGTSIDYDVFDCTTDEWNDYGDKFGSVGYGGDGFDPDYAFEVYGTSRWEARGYTMFVGDDGCGNRNIYIFDNDNKVEE